MKNYKQIKYEFETPKAYYITNFKLEELPNTRNLKEILNFLTETQCHRCPKC